MTTHVATIASDSALPPERFDVASLCELFQRTAAERGAAVALRSADDSTVVTWSEYATEVRALAAGLAGLGIRRGGTVALMIDNRPEFHLLDAATLHLGATSFSIYTTFTPEVIAHVLANSGATVVVCEQQYMAAILAARDACDIRSIVCLDGGDARSLTLDELKQAAPADFDFDAAWRAVQAGDVATLIYTSGTTGPPKGVELTHRNVLENLRASAAVLEVHPGDRAISALPMAHAAERWATHYTGFAHGQEVTCVTDLRTLPVVLPRVRPNIWGCVPRVWERLYRGLQAALDAEPDEAKRAAVAGAIELGLTCVRTQQRALRGDGPGPDQALISAWDDAERTVLSRLREQLGLDEVRWAGVGSAPMPPHVLEFFSAIRVPVCELWGMSELTCVATCTPPGEGILGSVGRALPGVDIRLAQDGEIEVHGPLVMHGYRGEPGKTAEMMTTDGWLRTGDIGRLDGDVLWIVDRKKEIIINASGKNMSPANIETTLKAESPLIAHAVAIGDGKPYVTALIALDPDGLGAWAARHGIARRHAKHMADDAQLIADIQPAVDRANAKLARVEQIRRFALVSDIWEPGSDLLTPTMKLKRRGIAARYAREIEDLYGA